VTLDGERIVPRPRWSTCLATRYFAAKDIRAPEVLGKKSGGDQTLNVTGYALAYRQLTGAVETDTVLDYLVATKKPYYLPIAAGGPVSDAQIVRFANVARVLLAAFPRVVESIADHGTGPIGPANPNDN
jgi:hypothetical protein